MDNDSIKPGVTQAVALDEDGDSTILTEEFRAQLQAELEDIKVDLDSCSETMRAELRRRCTHITKELEAGRYLPIEDD